MAFSPWGPAACPAFCPPDGAALQAQHGPTGANPGQAALADAPAFPAPQTTRRRTAAISPGRRTRATAGSLQSAVRARRAVTRRTCGLFGENRPYRRHRPPGLCATDQVRKASRAAITRHSPVRRSPLCRCPSRPLSRPLFRPCARSGYPSGTGLSVAVRAWRGRRSASLTTACFAPRSHAARPLHPRDNAARAVRQLAPQAAHRPNSQQANRLCASLSPEQAIPCLHCFQLRALRPLRETLRALRQPTRARSL